MDLCNLWLTEDKKGITSNVQDKTGIQNYLDPLKAVSENRRMTQRRSRSGVGQCKHKRTGGRSQAREQMAHQHYGGHDHGVGGGRGLKKKMQQDANQKTQVLGHMWCIFNTQGNYPALLSSSELQLEFRSTFLTRQHMLRNITRSQRNFMKTTSVFAGLTCEEGLKELGLFSLGR